MHSKKLDYKKIIIFAVFVSAITIALTGVLYWFYNISTIYDVKELGMDVYVDNIAGLNVDTDAIHFGIIPPGAGGLRALTVTAGEFRSKVTLQHSGDISDWVSVSDNNFILEAYENRTVDVSIRVPDDIKPVDFKNGTLMIIFRKI